MIHLVHVYDQMKIAILVLVVANHSMAINMKYMKYTVQVFSKAVYIELRQVGPCFHLKQIGLPEQTIRRWTILKLATVSDVLQPVCN